MPSPPLLQRLKERKLVQWALAYLAGAFVVFQAVEVMAVPWGISPGFQRGIHVLLLIGLFITLVLAWYHGEKGRQKVGGLEFLILTALLITAGAGLKIIGSEGAQTESTPGMAEPPFSEEGVVRIALLPLADMSPNPEDAYFAAGVHVDLWEKLSQIPALRVISLPSVEQFRIQDDRPAIPQISAALGGVDYLLAGSARVGGGQARISLLLFDGRTGQTIWSDSFDSPYAVEDFIRQQGQLAREITSELQVEITPDGQARIEELPTENEEAHQLYLKALAAQDRGLSPIERWDPLNEALRHLEEAIALDSTFALAHAALSMLHGRFYFLGRDQSESRLTAQRVAAEEALRLRPNLPQTRFAMGYVHYVNKEYRAALEAFEKGLEGMPSESTVQLYVAAAHRRLGQWSEALAHGDRAIRLDPVRGDWYGDILGLTLWATHRYAEASTAQSRALALSPELWRVAYGKGMVHLAWEGQLDTLKAAISRTSGVPMEFRVLVSLLEREPDSALVLLRGEPDSFWTDDIYLLLTRSQLSGWAHQMNGDDAAASAAFDSARVALEAFGEERPEDGRVLGGLGFAYAGLGRRDDAVRVAERFAEPNLSHPFDWAEMGHVAAQIYAQAGAVERAIAVLETLLSGPSLISAKTVETDWRYDPVRSDPRFQALLQKYADDVEH